MDAKTTTTVPGHTNEKTNTSEMVTAEPASLREDGPPPATEKSEPQVQLSEETSTENDEYISGIKLFLIVAVVSLSMFTMLLDTSIIVTVSGNVWL